MKVLISERFKKSIPKEKENIIKLKLDKFVEELKNTNYNIKNISNGFSVWKVRGSQNVYKFRVDRANRILFTFTSKIKWINDEYEDDENLFILDYCNHDEQIHRSKNLKLNVGYIDLDNTNLTDEEKEIFCDDIDYKYENYFYNNESDIVSIYNDSELENIFGLNNKEIIYKLNENQKEILNTKTPLFLFGSAGSGKTTVSVRKIRCLYDFNDLKIGYFTYSELLKTETEKVFNYLGKNSKNINTNSSIEFHNISTYLQNITGKKAVIKYEGFKNWLDEKHILKHFKTNADSFEVYREIRGFIKGMIGVDWGVNDFNLCLKNMLDKDDYINLPKKFPNFYDKDLCYDIAKKYQNWLNENDFVDDNDLTVLAIKLLKDKNIEKYDFLVVDEVQDLTEKQIYLLYKLVKNPSNIIFSGDFNQTINATYFDTHRIKSLFKLHSEKINFNEKFLNINYRSSKEIVKLANKISTLRIDKINKNKNDYIEKYIDLGTYESFKPLLLKTSDFNKENLLKTANERHYVAIVVCDEFEKKKLKDDLNIKNNVFTVSEIKGIEVPYVICYNIISKNKKQWENILNDDIVDKNSNLYRYYFNMFYVAITRARKNICFYEDEVCKLYDELFEFIDKIDDFNEDTLNLNVKSSQADYFKTGLDYEANGLYEQALNQYKKSNVKESYVCIKRCEALILKEKGKFFEAGEILFDIGEYNLAFDCYVICKSDVGILKSMLFKNKTYEEILFECDNLNIKVLDLIAKIKDEFVLDKFYEVYNKHLENKLKTQSNNIKIIKNIIDEISVMNF